MDGITRSEIRNRSSRNVFVMPADAYLSYIRFHHKETRFVDFEIKLPPRADQATERGESGENERKRKRENMEAKEITEEERDEREGRSKAGERTKPGTLNLEGLSRTT